MIEISLAVLEIWKAEFCNFTVPANNTLACRMSSFVFLAADTLLCVLTGVSEACYTEIYRGQYCFLISHKIASYYDHECEFPSTEHLDMYVIVATTKLYNKPI